MKRLRLIPVLGLCLCLAGCGNGAFAPKTEGAAAGTLESATAQSSAASEQASEADSKDNETADSGNTAEEEELSQYEIWREYIGGKDKSEITLDEESEKLYSGFINGEVEAEYAKNCSELCDYFDLSTDKKSYTLPEIESMIDIDRAKITSVEDYLQIKYIDLGLDERYELMVRFFNSEDSHGYGLSLVVKNLGGKLKICCILDEWDRCSSNVTYSGLINVGGSSGAMSHSGTDGYLDADGNYHLWYDWDSDGYETFHERPDEEIVINDVRIGGDDIIVHVNRYTFYDNKTYITINVRYCNPDRENATDLDDAYEKAGQALVQSGEKLCTEEEIENIIEEYRKKLGISDEVYTYGDEFKPDDF